MSLAAVIFVSLMTTTVGQSSTAASSDDAAQQAQTQQTQAQQTQESKQNPAAGQDDNLPVSLDRIRKALDETPAPAADAPRPKLKVDATAVPVFRTQTQGTTVKLTPVFDDGTDVGAYVRPPLGLYDYEFKQMVTPDAVKRPHPLTASGVTICLNS